MIIFGKRVVLYVLDKYPDIVEEIYLSKKLDKATFKKFTSHGKKIINLDSQKAQSLARGGNHQGMLLKIKDIEFSQFEDIKRFNSILILSEITDVGNIGAIIRSAYALGVEAVVLSGVKDANLEGLIRSSSGAIFDLDVVLYFDTMTLLNELKQIGFTIYGALSDGEDIRNVKFKDKRAIVLGSEGEGIRTKVLKQIENKVSINMAHSFDSLNVSVAAAIICDRMQNG